MSARYFPLPPDTVFVVGPPYLDPREALDAGREWLDGFMPLQAKVAEFHRAFGQPVLDRPESPDMDRVRLRRKLVMEEAFEFAAALGFPAEQPDWESYWNGNLNIVELADAIGDAMYVLQGTALEFGIDMGPVLAEIHRSNMAKLGPDGKPILDANGKIAKPPGWTPPDIAGVLRKQGYQP